MKQIAAVEIVRLKAIANMLDDVQESRFDLAGWMTERPRTRKTSWFGLVETQQECGFAGCAIGWAAHEEIIPNLSMTPHGAVVYNFNIDDVKIRLKGWEAVQLSLGLSPSMAHHLFDPSRYKVHATTEMVATRVRRLVAKVEAIRARDRRRAAKQAPVLSVVA